MNHVIEIILQVIIFLVTWGSYFAMGISLAKRQVKTLLDQGKSRSWAIARSRHLIIDWGPYALLGAIRKIGEMIDRKISDWPLTEAERAAKIRELEIDTGILDQMPTEKTSVERLLDSTGRLQHRFDKMDRQTDEWIEVREYYDLILHVYTRDTP